MTVLVDDPDPGLAGPRGDGAIDVAGQRLTLAEFLAECARTLGDPAAPIAAQRDRFLAAGLAALRRAPDGREWTAVGLRPADGRFAELCAELGTAARGLLAAGATNFFFMRKPPGLRVRLAGPPDLAAALRSHVDSWRSDGLLAEVVPSGYEPEEHLFGGPVSMRYVHRLFTVDSLAWLDHAARSGGLPAWAFSLRLIRALLDGLEIVGWEDLDVWDRLRRQAYRTLPAPVTGTAAYAAAAEGVRAAWAGADDPVAGYPATGSAVAGSAVADSAPAGFPVEVKAVAAEWRAGYFATPEAYVGPREAAAFAIVFHWNRGGLPPLRQGLLAEALADRAALSARGVESASGGSTPRGVGPAGGAGSGGWAR
ncbi:MAG TPA: thiopeptide-type bacteriocin biosynthesis protein [Mycobacteriales bacterium]|nr:thiopeptide-type bacteriocin biosynthesis protein [Mycobacteriales bacterium]